MPRQVERKSVGEGLVQIFSHEGIDRSGARPPRLEVSNLWVLCIDILLRDCDKLILSLMG